MSCCILAALLIAHIMAVLRRWAVFLGLVPPREYDDADTLPGRMRAWSARPKLRATLGVLVAVELLAGGTWIYAEHGTHLYRLGDQAYSAMRGERVIYSEDCGKPGERYALRMVIDESGRVIRNERVSAQS